MAAVCSAFALANEVAVTKGYLPEIQPAAHIVNEVAGVGGTAAALLNVGMGFFRQFQAKHLSFRALDQQLHHAGETEPPRPGEIE